ncbi:MAG: serine/threonine protein kinase [Myxococcales bacterium]|nr:serine/threonine protein kinase [Myxococcales bacterium]
MSGGGGEEPASGVARTIDVAAIARTLAAPSGVALAATQAQRGGASGPPGGAEGSLGAGERVGRYVILGRLGAGGMGEVYAAHDPELDRKVAIKLLLPRGDAESEATHRLLREAQALAKLAHPNVVTVFDVGQRGGRVFLAMELVEGVSVRAWLDEAGGRRPRAAVLEVFAPAARGLAALHAAGLVHRDVKPDNLMIGADGRVRVMDLGLARRGGAAEPAIDEGAAAAARAAFDEAGALDRSRDRLSAPVTVTGSLLGTPAYMAPEQFAGGVVDARADQFALCVALYEALYGVRPFVGETFAGLAMAVMNDDPRPPSAPRVPAWLRRALLRGLRRDPAARWPSMAALAELLDREPQRRRRRRLGLGIAALAIGGAIGVGVVVGEEVDEAALCAGADEEIAEVWGEPQRRAVAEAFAASGLRFAEASAAATIAGLDRYAAQWVEASRDACLDTEVRGFYTEEIREARARCLGDRRRALASAAEVLADADAEVVERGLDMVAALPHLDPCADSSYVLAAVEPPEDGATAVAVADLRVRLAVAEQLVIAAKYDAAFEALVRIEGAIDRTEYAPLLAEYLALLGEVLVRAGDPKEGVEVSREGYTLAEALGMDELCRDVATRLGFEHGSELGEPERGDLWFELAGAKLIRAPDPLAEARLLRERAYLDVDRGDFDAALEEVERARAIYERHLPPNHPFMISTLTYLAHVEERRQNLERSLEIGEDLVARQLEARGPDHPALGNTHYTVGATLVMSGRSREALAHFQEAARIFGEIRGDHPMRIQSLAAYATAEARLGRYVPARAELERALQLQLQVHGPDHQRLAPTYIQRGLIVLRFGELAEAAASDEAAVRILEVKYGPDHPHIAVALTNLGAVRIIQGRYADAEAALTRALEIRRAKFGEGHAVSRNTWLNLARTARARGLLGRARERYARTLEIVGEGDAGLDAELALVALEAGDRPEARARAASALALAEAEAAKDPVGGLGLALVALRVASRVEAARGDAAAAEGHEAELRRRLADHRGASPASEHAELLAELADTLWSMGDPAYAHALALAAEAVYGDAGDDAGLGFIRGWIAAFPASGWPRAPG